MSRIISQQLVIMPSPGRLPFGTPCRLAPKGEAGIVQLFAASNNTGVIFIGAGDAEVRSTLRYSLVAGQREMLWVDNLHQLHFFGTASGDILEFFSCVEENF